MSTHHQKTELYELPQSRRQESRMSSTRLLDVLQLSSTLTAGTANPFMPSIASKNGEAFTYSSLTKLALPPPPVCTTASFPPPPPPPPQVQLPSSNSNAAQDPETKQRTTAPTPTVHYYHHHFPIALTSTKLSHLTPFMLAQTDGLSMEDIAKEATRIAKESIRKQEEQQKACAAARTDDTASLNNAISHALECLPTTTTTNISPAHHPAIPSSPTNTPNLRLNKFVRRLHDMLQSEKDQGVVEWRRGLLVLHSTATFAKNILPKFFNTRNFKTFRRQLNYYGFVHVRSFSNTAAATTTALWVHQDLAASLHGMANHKHEETTSSATTNNKHPDPDNLSHILKLRRVEPNDDHKTVEGRRQRKEMALYTVEEDLQVSTKSLQRQQIQSLLAMSSNAQGAAKADDESRLASVATPPNTTMTQLEPSSSSSLNKAGVPLVIDVPSSSSPEKKRSFAAAAADEKSLPFKKKKARLAATAIMSSDTQVSNDETVEQPSSRIASYRTVSMSSSSTAMVSSDDDENNNCPMPRPIKTESSAANLLLLLSRASQQVA